ncbi:MAG: protein kinase [Streptosporangiales bacterium]|nr:protein kinase [Streptosporangiales bacterium]
MGSVRDIAAAVRPELASYTRELLATDGDAWHLESHEVWCTAIPRHRALAPQGWKIHVSATPASVHEVLDGAVPVLRRHAVAFKVARDLDAVRWLTGRDCDRALAGKVLTVYPADDAAFVAVATDLHDAVGALPGPRILSDRPYAPGSSIHYRYGGFRGDGQLDDDGVYRHLLTAPDGSTTIDRREAWFSAPSWAPDPLLAQPLLTQPLLAQPLQATASPAQSDAGAAVLLGDRYVVRGALRHSAKGGVYLARDERTGADVVVKHARTHAEVDSAGHDARDLLRNEARALEALAGVAPVPRSLGLFEQDGDVFLAQERLAGRPLRSWVHELAAARPGVPQVSAWPVARALTAAVAAVHGAGLVLRDLSPTNVLVDDDGTVHLVDLELATPVGGVARRSGTPAYQAPEHHTGDDRVTATVAEDLYSLGCLLFLIATGCDPLLPADDGAGRRPLGDRLAGWLDLVAAHGDSAAAARPAIRGLLAADPACRWSLADVESFLAAQPDQVAPAVPVTAAGVTPPDPARLLSDGLAYLLDTMTPERTRLWPTGSFGGQTDAGNVQHGAAGVLVTLAAAMPHATDAATTRAVATAASWLTRQVPPRPPRHPLPGLYFGRAGVAWALADAGSALGDDALVDAAVHRLLRLPAAWPNPDVAHGLAGACLAHVHLARRTGDERLARRADAYADALAAAADEDELGPYWRIPADSDSVLAGKVHHGFAHGAAGIGYALLANGRDADVRLAVRTGDALCRAAQVDGDGAAWWPVGQREPTRLPHWCSGSSGIGTFLLRLYASTGERRFADHAIAAATAVHRSRWQSSPAACHGLAGDGQFLLDAADVLVDPTYHALAADLATCLAARHCVRDGRVLVPDEGGRDVVADHQVGVAGVVAFLTRLLHGGPRPFMVDGEARPC